jgi:hypothetical protein
MKTRAGIARSFAVLVTIVVVNALVGCGGDDSDTIPTMDGSTDRTTPADVRSDAPTTDTRVDLTASDTARDVSIGDGDVRADISQGDRVEAGGVDVSASRRRGPHLSGGDDGLQWRLRQYRYGSGTLRQLRDRMPQRAGMSARSMRDQLYQSARQMRQ